MNYNLADAALALFFGGFLVSWGFICGRTLGLMLRREVLKKVEETKEPYERLKDYKW